MKKPEPPKSRLIREDFLPDIPMNKYRIKKVIEDGQELYYPQKKFLWWWRNVNLNGFSSFYDLEYAKKVIRDTNVEYIYDLD
jgi:hypothetical protein